MTNILMQPVLRDSGKYLYQECWYPATPKTRNSSILDAFQQLRHARIYGPSSLDSVTPTKIIYSKYPSKTCHLSFVIDGKRVKAERETYTIEGEAQHLRPLGEYLSLTRWQDQPATSDTIADDSYLPALMLNSLDWMPDDELAVLERIGITANIMPLLKKHRGVGSWLDIVAATELWHESDYSLAQTLNLCYGCVL